MGNIVNKVVPRLVSLFHLSTRKNRIEREGQSSPLFTVLYSINEGNQFSALQKLRKFLFLDTSDNVSKKAFLLKLFDSSILFSQLD